MAHTTLRHMATPSRSFVFRQLRRSSPYQTFRQAFADTAGLPLYLEPGPGVQGVLSPEPELGNRNGFCRAVNPGGSCLRCCMSRIPADAPFETQSSTWTCQAGLQTTVVPVLVDPTPIAWLVTGQVRVQNLKKPTRRLANTTTPVMASSRYTEISALLREFAERLRGLVNAIIIQAGDEDTSLVARTKALLRLEAENADRGSGGRNLSDFEAPSLRMLFEEETGMSMEEFALRCRVEKARQRLIRTGEGNESLAAYAGYGEPGAFVRDFRSFVGESPQDHHKRMQASGSALENWLNAAPRRDVGNLGYVHGR